MKNNCELCNLEKKTKWYYEDDNWIICDCLMCKEPMLIYRKHTMNIPEEDLSYIFHLLRYDFESPQYLFGTRGKLIFRTFQKKIKDHFHWHIIRK